MSDTQTANVTPAPAAEAPAGTTPESTTQATAETGSADWRARRAALAAPEQAAPAEGTEAPAEAPEAKPEPEKGPDKYGPRFAALAKKEARLRTQAEAFKAEQAQWAETRSFLDGFQTSLSSDPVSALRTLADKAGVPFAKLYSQVTQALLQDGQPPDPVEAAKEATKAELEAWKAEQTKAAQEAKDNEQRQMLQGEYETTLSDLSLMVADYPLCSAPMPGQTAEQRAGQIARAALAEMAEEYGRTKNVLDYNDALSRIETELQTHLRGLEAAEARAKAAKSPSDSADAAVRASTQGLPNLPAKQAPRPTLAHSQAQEAGPPRQASWKENRARILANRG